MQKHQSDILQRHIGKAGWSDPASALGNSTCFGSPATERYRGSSSARAGSLITNLSGEICYATDLAASLLAREADAIVGLPAAELFTDLPLRAGATNHNQAYVEQNFMRGDWIRFHYRDGRGRIRSIELSMSLLRLDATCALFIQLRPPSAPGTLMPDLTNLIEHACGKGEGIVITDTEGAIVFANSTFQTMKDYNGGDASEGGVFKQRSKFQKHGFYPDVWSKLSRDGEAHCLFVNSKKNGELYVAEETIRPFVDCAGNVTHFVGTQRDVSSREVEFERLLHLAHFDSLTGLPNRNLFLDRLHHEIARAKRSHVGFTLFFLDMDGFKSVNDAQGHAAGDQLLQKVATRLTQCVRDSDTVARLGGDEFAIILPELTKLSDTIEMLDKIRLGVSGNVDIDGAACSIAISIGAAAFPEHAKDDTGLLKAADTAMYQAKRASACGWCIYGASA